MMDNETRWVRRLATIGILAVLTLVGVSIATYLYHFATSTTVPTMPLPRFFPFGWLWGLFFIFIAFWLVRLLFLPWRWGWHYGRRYWRYGDSAYYILRERYARGEITREQFEEMMRDLQQHSQTP